MMKIKSLMFTMDRFTNNDEKFMINNAFYGTLKDLWYTSQNFPISMLRAENAARTPWVLKQITRHFWKKARVLDIGCGAGWLSNSLALHGYEVTGIDAAAFNLNIARKYDQTRTVQYQVSEPNILPFPDGSFEVVCAMDILEHVQDPKQIVREASRVLRTGGLFLFHTFNRNLLTYAFAIKTMNVFLRNAPQNKHIHSQFIKPKELKNMCQENYLWIDHMLGFQPRIWSSAFWKLLKTRIIPNDLEFTFCNNLTLGYSGAAKKRIHGLLKVGDAF